MSGSDSKSKGIDRYHGLDTDEEQAAALEKIYADWAVSYDYDNDHKLGTVSQPNAVKLLGKHLADRSAEILDVASGTGQVGLHLAKVGFTTFDGTDISQDMMGIAQSRGYRNLVQSNADEGLPFDDDSYAATICVGLFTHGHPGPYLIAELLRVTRPGGLVVFTVNEGVWQSGGFDAEIEKLTDSRNWELLEQTKQPYMVKEGVEGWYIVARKPT